jgi:hypothetical protein
MFAPPTVWISFLRHEAFEERDLASLEKVQYGASIEVAVIGLSDEKWIEAVSALVVPKRDAETEDRARGLRAP